MKLHRKWLGLPIYFHVIVTLIAILSFSSVNSLGKIDSIADDLSDYNQVVREDLSKLENGQVTSFRELSEGVSLKLDLDIMVVKVGSDVIEIPYNADANYEIIEKDLLGVIQEVYLASVLREVVSRALILLFVGSLMIMVATVMLRYKLKFSQLIRHYSFALFVNQVFLILNVVKDLNKNVLLVLYILSTSIVLSLSLKSVLDKSLTSYYLGLEEGT